MDKTAVIASIGGSLAGLLHGIMLNREGYAVTILERDSAIQREGFDAGIRVGPDFVTFLTEYDLIKRPYDIPAAGQQFIGRDGALGRRFNQELTMSSWGLLLSILRANFDGMPSKAIPQVPARDVQLKEVKYKNCALAEVVEDNGDVVQVRYKDVFNGKMESISANVVIVADGHNSLIRRQLMPEVSREYAGYVSWRGTVRESSLEERHRGVFQGNTVLHLMDRSYILVYIIPTDDGSLEIGERLYNWVWYDHLPEGSKEHSETMTDIHGRLHHGTVPRGLVCPEIWGQQRSYGMSVLPPAIAALVEKTYSPFVTKIYDAAATKARLFDDKLFIVGDALFAFRPHVALSTNQAAYDCRLLKKVLVGEMSARDWERAVLKYGNATRMLSVVVGTFGTGSRLAFLFALAKFVLLLLRQKIGFTI